MRFMMQRADDFHILRRKPVPVCETFTGDKRSNFVHFRSMILVF